MEDPQWETSKENVLPLKRGRSTKKLADAFLAQSEGSHVENSAMAAFEKELSEARSLGSDVLDIYVRYFKWTRDQYPSNSSKAMQLLERCTAQLVSNPKFKNDLRFVQMWIEYADMVRTPGEIFTYMSGNKIGEKSALFWMSWAFVAEKNENFNLTDQIFQKGIKKNAEPKDLLMKRYQQYQRRMARRYLNSVNADGTTSAPGAAGPARTSASAATNENIPGGTTARAPLSLLQLQQQQVPKSTAPAPKSTKSNSTFTIFSEDSEPTSEAGRGAAQLEGMDQHDNKHWKRLGSEASRRKENDGPATRWTDGGVTGPMATSAPASSIAVFVDEEFLDDEEAAVVPEAIEPVGGGKAVMSMRRALDGPAVGQDGVEASAASILKNPLARHPVKQEKEKTRKSEAEGVTKASKPSSSKISSGKSSSSSAGPRTTVKPPAPPAAAPTPGGAGKFAIFSDDFDAEADCGIKASAVKSVKTIPIYADASPPAAKPAVKPAIAIFCDENDHAPVPAPAAAPKTASKPRLASIPDVPAASDLPQDRSTHSLNSTGCNGTPTATINTKLAMMDIDLMFQDEENQENSDMDGGLGDFMPAPVTATPFFKPKASLKRTKKPIQPYCDTDGADAPLSRPPKTDKNTTCDTVEIRDLMRAVEEEDDSMESSVLVRQEDQHRHRTPAVHSGGEATSTGGPGSRILGTGGAITNISDIKPASGPDTAFRRSSSSRRRPRADSEEPDDTGVFGHLAMGAHDDSDHFMASPSLNFTGTITAGTGVSSGKPALQGPPASGFAIFQDESPVSAAPPVRPPAAPVTASRSKRTKRQNDIWSGIDDLLEDPNEVPAPAPVPVVMAPKHAPHGTDANQNMGMEERAEEDEEDWLVDLQVAGPSKRYVGRGGHRPPMALGQVRQSALQGPPASGFAIFQDESPVSAAPPVRPPAAPVTASRSKRTKRQNDIWSGIDDLLEDPNEVPAPAPVPPPCTRAVTPPRTLQWQTRVTSPHSPRTPGIALRTADQISSSSSEDSLEALFQNNPRRYRLCRVPDLAVGEGHVTDSRNDNSDGEEKEEDVFSDLGVSRWRGRGARSLHRLVELIGSQPPASPCETHPTRATIVATAGSAPMTPLLSIEPCLVDSVSQPVVEADADANADELDALCLVEITLMNHDKFLNRSHDASGSGSGQNISSSSSSADTSSADTSSSSTDTSSSSDSSTTRVAGDHDSLGSLTPDSDASADDLSVSPIDNDMLTAVQSLRVSELAETPIPATTQESPPVYVVLDVKEQDTVAYREWPRNWEALTAPGACCAGLCVDYRPPESPDVSASASASASASEDIIRSIKTTLNGSNNNSSVACDSKYRPKDESGRLPACFKRKISLPNRGAKKGPGVTGSGKLTLQRKNTFISATECATTAIGSGTFGYCLLANIKEPGVDNPTGDGAGKVIKVDPDTAFVVWEVYVHQEIQTTLQGHDHEQGAIGDGREEEELVRLRRVYSTHFLPPQGLWLYSNAAVMVLPYANAKTLLDLVNVMIRGKNGLNFDGGHGANVNANALSGHRGLVSRESVGLTDQESIAVYFMRQMVDAMAFMHGQHLAHGDIKPNNWVLRAHFYPQVQRTGQKYDCGDLASSAAALTAGCISHITVCLIDFGKAKHLRDQRTGEPVFFSGNGAADGMACPQQLMKPSAPSTVATATAETGLPAHLWTVHPDCYGLASCTHNLLFTEELRCTHESLHQAVRSRGYYYNSCMGARGDTEEGECKVWVPKASLKRHWNKLLWSNFYLTFLNYSTQDDYTTFVARYKAQNAALLAQMMEEPEQGRCGEGGQLMTDAPFCQKLRYLVSLLLPVV